MRGLWKLYTGESRFGRHNRKSNLEELDLFDQLYVT